MRQSSSHTASKDHPATISSASTSAVPASDQQVDLSQLMPDSWPELEYVNTDESVSDGWLKQIDPLIGRQLPVSDSGTINAEAERAPDPGLPTETITASFPLSERKNVLTRLRLIFAILVIIIVLALIVDAILITVGSPRSRFLTVATAPLLTVTPKVAYPGEQVLLHISQFSPFAHVFLTRDIQELVHTTTNSPLIALDAAGSADVHILIDKSWTTGAHTIEGEDVTTRYTASTTMQILGAGPPERPQLTINQNGLDMGADLQGANTIMPFTLHNLGGASVAWVVNSNQPWLMTTPTSGVFSDSQPLAVAVTRAQLAPGKNYQGTLTFTSNVSAPLSVHVKMTVLALPPHPGAVLEVTPPALAFTATDGGPAPANQTVAISNPGSQPLSWSFAGSSPIVSSAQTVSPQSDSNWLSAATTSGVVAPGSTQRVYVQVQSHDLLAGVYSDLLTFTTASGGLNKPQHVAVSLTVQPRTPGSPVPTDQVTNAAASATAALTQSSTAAPGAPIINTIVPNLNFTYTQGHAIPAGEFVTIANSGGSPFSWQASIPPSASSWLSIAPPQGNIAANQSHQIVVSVNPGQLQPGAYSAQITVNGTDSAGVQIQNSPQVLTASLQVYASCSLQVAPANLAFATSVLSPISSSQSLTLTEAGNCNHLVLWTASGDHSWLVLSTTNGSGNGSVSVHANSQGMLIGSYTAQIRLGAVDSNHVSLPVSPSTISVTLTVNAA